MTSRGEDRSGQGPRDWTPVGAPGRKETAIANADVSLPSVDTGQLEEVVRLALDAPAATVDEGWDYRPLTGGFGNGTGIWHLAGSARVGPDRHPWALVLKSLPNGAGAPAWDDPRREAHAYRSGLLTALPGGLVAPRCYAVEDRPDGATWLWLEEIANDPAPWSDEQFARAAECLGRFNGAYLADAPLPSAPWMSRGRLRHSVEASGAAVVDLPRLAGDGAHDLVRRIYPPSQVAAITRLWDEHETFLAALDRLPRTFCHLDAFHRNLLGRAAPAPASWPVAVDWAFAGIGTVGEELVPLVLMPVLLEGRVARRLDAVCFAAYLAGLRAAGWTGDPALVRLGYTVAAALRYPVGTLWSFLPFIADPAFHPDFARSMGRPAAEAAAAYDAFWQIQNELAEEARSLLPLVA